MLLWDTQREKDINLGASYPFEPLEKGECIISSTFASTGISIGDTLKIKIYLHVKHLLRDPTRQLGHPGSVRDRTRCNRIDPNVIGSPLEGQGPCETVDSSLEKIKLL